MHLSDKHNDMHLMVKIAWEIHVIAYIYIHLHMNRNVIANSGPNLESRFSQDLKMHF